MADLQQDLTAGRCSDPREARRQRHDTVQGRKDRTVNPQFCTGQNCPSESEGEFKRFSDKQKPRGCITVDPPDDKGKRELFGLQSKDTVPS